MNDVQSTPAPTPRYAGSFWTAEHIEELRRRVLARQSSGDIAREMHITRNAVIGKTIRMGMHCDSASPNRRDNPERARHGRPADGANTTNMLKRIKARGVRKPPWKPAVAISTQAPAPQCRPVTFMGLTRNACRYTDDDEPVDMLFCGAPQMTGSSYCEFHHHVCTAESRR